jgi:hypothetical protein
MIALRDARNAYARSQGYDNYFSLELAQMGFTQKIVHSDVREWFKQMHALPSFPDETMRSLSPIESLYDTRDVTRRVVERLGLGDAYDRITQYELGNGGETPKTIPIDPPREVAVVVPYNSTNLWVKNAFFSEIGHGLHYASMKDDLPYMFRLGSNAMPWREAMDALFVRLATMHIREDPTIKEGKLLEAIDYERKIRSLCGTMIRTFFDAYFYTTTEQNPDVILREWKRIKLDLYGKDRPLYAVVDVPDGYERVVHEWANDSWITERPVELGFLLGAMIAAQIRAYWLKNGGTLLSREFGAWIRETCWEPGFSKPWRELLRDATGEDFNPRYFLDELEEMKRQRSG